MHVALKIPLGVLRYVTSVVFDIWQTGNGMASVSKTNIALRFLN